MVPDPLANSLRPAWQSFRQQRIRTYQKAAGLVGLNLTKTADYYSVAPVLENLYRNEARWNRPSKLPGVNYELDELRTAFDQLISEHAGNVLQPEQYDEVAARGFGPGYPRVDAICLYAMIRKLKPARYIEVGSGLSTHFAWLAGQENAKEGRPMQITCVEPYPRPLLKQIPGIELIVDEVQNVPLDKFVLGSGDVLFIDSSHALRIDSDVAYLFLEVVPRVRPGVHIHVHDVPFPYNVPQPAETWILGHRWPVFWQEAMLLQAFLAYNDSFKIRMSVPLIRESDPAYIASRIPGYPSSPRKAVESSSSLWMQRIK